MQSNPSLLLLFPRDWILNRGPSWKHHLPLSRPPYYTLEEIDLWGSGWKRRTLFFFSFPLCRWPKPTVRRRGRNPMHQSPPLNFWKSLFSHFGKKISFSSYNPIRHFFFLLPIPKGERMKEKERGREWKNALFLVFAFATTRIGCGASFFAPIQLIHFPISCYSESERVKEEKTFLNLVCQSHITLFPFVSKFANWDISSREKKSAKRYKLARICQDRQFRRQKTQRKQKKYSAPHNQENGLTKPFPPCSLSLSMHAKQAAPFLNPHDLSEALLFSPCVSN